MFGDIFADGGRFFGRDDSVPIENDPPAEARRLARQWAAYRDKVHALYYKHEAFYKAAAGR